jgi:hypothetical protein
MGIEVDVGPLEGLSAKGHGVTPIDDSRLVPGLVQGAQECPSDSPDEDLALVCHAWSRLPRAVRKAVLSLLETAFPVSKDSTPEED